MTTSELISALQDIQREFGNVPVYFFERFAQCNIDIAEARKIVAATNEKRCGEIFVALTSKPKS